MDNEKPKHIEPTGWDLKTQVEDLIIVFTAEDKTCAWLLLALEEMVKPSLN